MTVRPSSKLQRRSRQPRWPRPTSGTRRAGRPPWPGSGRNGELCPAGDRDAAAGTSRARRVPDRRARSPRVSPGGHRGQGRPGHVADDALAPTLVATSTRRATPIGPLPHRGDRSGHRVAAQRLRPPQHPRSNHVRPRRHRWLPPARRRRPPRDQAFEHEARGYASGIGQSSDPRVRSLRATSCRNLLFVSRSSAARQWPQARCCKPHRPRHRRRRRSQGTRCADSRPGTYRRRACDPRQ